MSNGYAGKMSRKEFLTATGGLVAGGLLSRCVAAQAADRTGDRPNVLIVFVDDLGYGDLSSYGAEDMRTPNIDKLVKQGMRFENAYANCPVCSPTRAALLTGRYPELVGVPGVIRTHWKHSFGRLSPDCKLLPQLLKPLGYSTAIVGKWHLGLKRPDTPNDRGFDFFHGFLGDMMDDYYHHRRHNNNYMRLNRKTIDPKGHATDLFTQWACDYIKRRKSDEPFFLYLAYNAPHTPIQPPKDWLEKVKKRQPNINRKRARLVALIEHLDDGIGRVLDTLDDVGLADDTLVVFASDNGGQTRVGARNGPVRAGKGTVYEGGIRVPMSARWPGKIKPETKTERIALSMDILPTVIEAAGGRVRHKIDGVSFLPTLLGKSQPQPERDLFFCRREGADWTIECIRRGDWKLLRPGPRKPLELYNLADDPQETTNLAGKERAKFEELKKAFDAQLARYSEVPWHPRK